MKWFVVLLVFWASAPVFSNDFVACGWQIDTDDQRRAAFELEGDARAPFAVHFSYYSVGPNGSGNLNHCGGALIAPGWVLTARHCVGQKRWAYLGVNVPELERSVEADLAICPSEAVPFPQNDVALLRLTEPLPGALARVGDAIEAFPLVGHIPRWPIRRGRPAREMLYSEVEISRETPTPMLAGLMVDRVARVPCGGESGSMLVDGDGRLAGVLTAISSPGGGRPNCNDSETRIFVTPLSGWADWIADVIAACESEVCSSPE